MKDRFFIVAYSCLIPTMDGLTLVNGNATFEVGKFPVYSEIIRFAELVYNVPVRDLTVLNIMELTEADYDRLSLTVDCKS